MQLRQEPKKQLARTYFGRFAAIASGPNCTFFGTSCRHMLAVDMSILQAHDSLP